MSVRVGRCVRLWRRTRPRLKFSSENFVWPPPHGRARLQASRDIVPAFSSRRDTNNCVASDHEKIVLADYFLRVGRDISLVASLLFGKPSGFPMFFPQQEKTPVFSLSYSSPYKIKIILKGLFCGSDGTRTRNFRRDRAVL